MKLSAASLLVKIWPEGTPPNLKETTFSNTFSKNKIEGLLLGFENSKYKIGRQTTRNWCGSVLSEIKVPWTNINLTNERIRIIFKSTFYLHRFKHIPGFYHIFITP